MIEGREHLGLALESREAFGIGCKQVRQDLQRDVAIQPCIVRAIHLAMPPAPIRAAIS